MNPKGRQAKSRARLSRFESLTLEDDAAAAAARASLDNIFIPPGPPLGTTVVEAKVGELRSASFSPFFSLPACYRYTAATASNFKFEVFFSILCPLFPGLDQARRG